MKVTNYIQAAFPRGNQPYSKYRSFLKHSINLYKFLVKSIERNSNKDKVFFFLLDKEQQEEHFKRILNKYNTKHRLHQHLKMNNSRDDSMSSYLKGKLLGAYKSTKESSYVKNLYQETSSMFSNNSYLDNSNSQSNSFTESLPLNSQITIYPCYSKHENGEYITIIKGVLAATGILSRKNRFLLNMARRISKSSDENIDSQFESELKDSITNQDSYRKGDDVSEYSNSINSDDTIKTRMEGILAKTIPGILLNVTVGSETPVDQLVGAQLSTDNFGIFQISIVTPYKPNLIEVSCAIDSSVLQTSAVEIVEDSGISIITDIDDTVRLTGVIGEKREVFRNIFSKPYSACEIPGVASWFQRLHESYNCTFHYVSNSPWQIFNIVQDFLSYFDFPITSVHLRQYSGNLVASFTQPSAERKRPSMVNLMNDFPDRKFLLIGDTGEQDLEAYLSLVPNFADRILAIYLRVVPNSLSSIGNDKANLNELKSLLSKRNDNGVSTQKVYDFLKNPTGIDSDVSDNEPDSYGVKVLRNATSDVAMEVGNVVGEHMRRRSSFNIAKNAAKETLNKVSKLPPIVPKKPDFLRGTKIIQNIENGDISVPLTNETSNHSETGNIYVHPPIQGMGTGSDKYNENLQFTDDSMDMEMFNGDVIEDKKFNLWKLKIQKIINEVPEHIDVQFWTDVETIEKESVKIIESQLK